MKKLLILSLVIAGLFPINSCKKNQPTYSDTGVRILNATSWTFYDCTIDPFGTLSIYPGPYAYNYGQVNINSTSDYHVFAQIHRYAWVRLTMNNRTYLIRPYDYVGETPLSTGRFTYKISYDATLDILSLELVND